MKFWIIACKVLGYIWVILAGLLMLGGIIGAWMTEGFAGVQRLLSPFNIVNWVVTVVTLAPGIGLLTLSERLRAKLDESN